MLDQLHNHVEMLMHNKLCMIPASDVKSRPFRSATTRKEKYRRPWPRPDTDLTRKHGSHSSVRLLPLID